MKRNFKKPIHNNIAENYAILLCMIIVITGLMYVNTFIRG